MFTCVVSSGRAVIADVHLCGIVRESGFPDLEKEFEPNILNSTVYIISITLQVATFAINYRVSLRESDKPPADRPIDEANSQTFITSNHSR